MNEFKRLTLTTSLHILMLTVMSNLTQIAYKESIYDDIWIASIYVILTYVVAYFLAKSILRNNK